MTTKRYRLPSKLKKFGITDPSAVLLVAKYENEIPWVTGVKDEVTLIEHVRSHMLPALLGQVVYPVKPGARHAFIDEGDVDLEQALSPVQELDQHDVEAIRTCREREGDAAAVHALVDAVNRTKASGFKVWVDELQARYLGEPLFQYLLLRPLFAPSGKGVRRALVPPDLDVVAWLHRRITAGRVPPYVNVAKEYALKVAFGSGFAIRNGWQFIPSDVKLAGRLAAACRGSGWCVASSGWGRSYLKESAFFILHSGGRPVVALRTDPQRTTVLECQGRCNEEPVGYHVDIGIFTRTLGMMVGHREGTVQEAMDAVDLAQMPLVWWRERLERWPLAIKLAPELVRNNWEHVVPEGAWSALLVVGYEELRQSLPALGQGEELEQLVTIAPQVFPMLGHDVVQRDGDRLEQACMAGWMERVEQEYLTMHELRDIPSFVKDSPRFRVILATRFPAELDKAIVKRAATYAERMEPVDLQDLLPTTADEPMAIAEKRALNLLLNVDTDDFSDIIFPDELQDRPEFAAIREAAWAKAVQVDPTMRLALPQDLQDKPEFAFDQRPVVEADLKEWERKVREKPWLLNQRKGVPARFRQRRTLLVSYLEGWCTWLIKDPSRTWAPIRTAFGGRAYLAYAALRNIQIVEALVQGFTAGFKRGDDLFMKASERMQEIMAYRLAALVASHVCGRLDAIRADSELKERLMPGMPPSDVLEEMVVELLTGDARAAVARFYGPRRAQNLHLTSYELAKPVGHRVGPGSKVRLKVGSDKRAYIIGRAARGYATLAEGSLLARALYGLKAGDHIRMNGVLVVIESISS